MRLCVLRLASWWLESDELRAAARRADSLCQRPAVTTGGRSPPAALLLATLRGGGGGRDQFPPVCQLSDLFSMATLRQSSKVYVFNRRLLSLASGRLLKSLCFLQKPRADAGSAAMDSGQQETSRAVEISPMGETQSQ